MNDVNVALKSNKQKNLGKKLFFLEDPCRKEQDPDPYVSCADPDPYHGSTALA
jgi:hypothetical protein